jgi:hypothetical protein
VLFAVLADPVYFDRTLIRLLKKPDLDPKKDYKIAGLGSFDQKF